MFDCICAVLRGSVLYISFGLSAVKINEELLLLLLCTDLPAEYLQVLVTVGESVTLPCHTSLDADVDWWYLETPTAPQHYVHASGYIQKDFKERFSLYSPVTSTRSLVISDVRFSDSGLYICIEDAGLGRRHKFELIVTGKLCLLILSTLFLGD